MTRSVELKSGGIVVLATTSDFNVLTLTDADRHFFFALVDLLNAYEAGPGTANETDGSPKLPPDGQTK